MQSFRDYVCLVEQSNVGQKNEMILTPAPTTSRNEFLLQLITSREESAAIRQQLRQVEDMDETDWPTYRATLVRQVCSPDETT